MEMRIKIDREWMLKVIANTIKEVYLLSDQQKLEMLYSKYNSAEMYSQSEMEEDLKWIHTFWF